MNESCVIERTQFDGADEIIYRRFGYIMIVHKACVRDLSLMYEWRLNDVVLHQYFPSISYLKIMF
jgi:hypothetical protein